MYKGHPFANKLLDKMQKERLLDNHRNNIKLVRPTTEFLQTHKSFYTLNQKKKEMQKQSKYTEIERQNRLLLQKITTIMSKKRSGSQSQMNKSLNSSFRKKQFQSIEVQNAKMLKRLQDKKSDYEFNQLKQQWKKTKKMIKNISNYPLVIDNIKIRRRKKENTIQLQQLTNIVNNNPESFQLVKLRLINNKKFIITIKFTLEKLIIIGDLRTDKEIKVIQLDKIQGIKFIQENCQGNIHKIFDFLRYNEAEKSLYLTAQRQQKEQINIFKQQDRMKLRQKRSISRKPLYEAIDYNILENEDLIF